MNNSKSSPRWESMMQTNDLQSELSLLYDDTFIRTIARLAGPRANPGDLRKGIEAGVRAYLLTRRSMKRRKPGRLEARRLEPIADAAHSLHSTLSRIEGSPNPRLKLTEALEALAISESGPGAALIRDVEKIFGPGDPLRVLEDVTRLLTLAAAQTVGKAPGHSDENRIERHETLYETEIDAWNARTRKTETQPVIALARAFRPFWQRNSEHPYTEGMYQKQKLGTASISVDAVHRIGLRLDSNLPRKRVVTAFRALPPA